ncbi:MAG: MFS transporter [Bacteroidia bacterium]|nr:MFS transporter [Bacteroidia bacterium]
MPSANSPAVKGLNKLIIVAALGYFVDIYDLLLFGVERVASLNEIIPEQFGPMSKDSLSYFNTIYGKLLLNWQMAGMLIGGIFWGILGDKKGRLTVLFGSILIYSLANIANGMVHTISWYAALRFISGFGLAGELGAGITLVSESMSKERRGIGTMIVATVGVFGAAVAGFMGEVISNWRYSFYLGGGMGLVLLLLRIGVFESGMFKSVKEENVQRGNFFHVIGNRKRLLKYLCIILVTVPVWYVMGTLVLFSPGLYAKLSGDPVANLKAVSAGKSIMWAYAGITIGDIASGLISQLLKSRKKTLGLFLILTCLGIFFYFKFGGTSVATFYWIIGFIGFATGYWAVFISTASELFGTNIRSTVTTTAPNFVRGSTILISFLLSGMVSLFDGNEMKATIVTGCIILGIAFVALYFLEETFAKDLNYTE